MPAFSSSTDSSTLREAATEAVYRLGAGEGFGVVGIAAAKPSAHAQELRAWLAAGRHGEMHYLANHLDVRLDPRKLLPGAVSIIAVADGYSDDAPPASPAEEADRPRGRVARYAWGADYHKVLKKRLHRMTDALSKAFPQATFRAVVDTAPILEREQAQRAGLGWQAKNTLLIHPRFGSWFLLGVLVTSLELIPSAEAGYPRPTAPPRDLCGSCTRCIDACPTQAIAPQGYQLDATRCISYLTLEHRSAIDPALHAGMGHWVAGCDICQEVCPHNRPRRHPLPVLAAYAPRPIAAGLDLLAALNWTAEDRQQTFQGSALKRIKLEMVKRNALIALTNQALEAQSLPEALRRRLQELAEDPQELPMLRTTAEQCLQRLKAAQLAGN